MAYNPRDMDGFMPLLSTSDIKTKMTIGNNLISYLGNSDNSIECQDIGLFIDNVIPWLSNGNAKIVQNGLEILTQIADRMGSDFRPYISTIIQPTIDRLGDSKDVTREKARLVLLKIMERGSMTPQQLLDRLHPVFNHKNTKLREEALILLTTTLDEHGADEMALSAVIPSLVKVLSDPNEKVRETAVNTLVKIYTHVGERFKADLQRKHNVPQAKLQLLIERFEQVKADGDLLPSAMSNDVGREFDEPDRVLVAKSVPLKRTKSVLQKKSQFGPSTKVIPSSMGPAGAVDELTFEAAFNDVAIVNIFSSRDLEDQMKIIRETIGDDKKDWNQRTESLKKLRGIIKTVGTSHETFMELLKTIQNSMDGACTDLRSQVVKEACITLAFLSDQFKNKCANFIEGLLASLINLLQNSAKVVATSGAVALRIIFQNTHSPRFIPIIATSLSSKSKDIRRAACEYLSLILQNWSVNILQKHVKTLQEGIGKSIADSDSEARVFARKGYWTFKEHFPEQAEALLNSMDPSCKRTLMSQSNSGSMSSLPTSKIPGMPLRPPAARPTSSAVVRASPGLRSNSAIDLCAARRAHSRMLYANISRSKATTPRTAKPLDTVPVMSPERTPRTKTKVSGVSQSQPSSRSCSPSSRLSYATYNHREGDGFTSRTRRLSNQGMRSTDNSREPSPQRFSLDRSITAKIRGRNMYMSPKPPVMAQRMLQQSREAESALADALTFDGTDHPPRTPRGAKGDHSDDSETSSLCSERSIDARRPSDDIKDIIECCGRKHWGDRREGLIDLHHFLSNGNTLTATELRKVTDIFTKMFMDSQTKVFSLFIDTLNELIITHNEDLVDWLYVLCTRLLNKLGVDLLGSIQTKINKTLDIVRDYFHGDQLLPVVMRFITDPTQTPNSRVKVATLNFLTHITDGADPSALNSSCKTALVRLLEWTSDVKSQDVRRHAHDSVIALYNLNPPQFPMILNELPKYYQDIAMVLLQNHLRKSSSSSSNPGSPIGSGIGGSGGSSSGGMTPRSHQPLSRFPHRSHDDNEDHLNPEEVYKSLRKTTAEIQNYGFERMEAATSSKDSGISNMADIEERIESITVCNSGRSSSVSSPTQRGRSVGNVVGNGSSDTIAGDLILPDRRNNGFDPHSTDNCPTGPEFFERTLTFLQSDNDAAAKSATLQEFQVYIKNGDGAQFVKVQFKKLLKTMLDLLTSDDKILEIEVLRTIIEMLKCSELVECFQNYAELLVLKVLNEHKPDAYDPSSGSPRRGHGTPGHSTKPLQLLKAAEDCAAMIATVLPAGQVIHLALTTIRTEPFPKNVAAIKMIQNVVEHCGKDFLQPHLDDTMATLLLAYDNNESVVRKAAVFCMVAIHAAIGNEAFEPYKQHLYGGKLKLLNIYIQKAQEAGSSVSSSPRSNHS
ncbi:CLIP-associating protein 1-like isoform X2 [Aphidius gifuensis]|uniref:CLIP-associating protein 1-like isoform X2 n=1 Tax=Aphidius gifuensis TaxID=684658 RepID=UPI001CDD3D85|nr:CLIP-associating protein 1-like isoform X2 [Aphidius gifuensis]